MDMASLPRAVELAPMDAVGGTARNPHWHPGSAPALHSEIFAPANEASGAGTAFALAMDGRRLASDNADGASVQERAVLWVQDRKAIRLGGRPYRAGLPESLRHRLIHVAARTPEDALFALEEGMRCRDLACVIGEVAGNPKAMDFTASRRLTLAAEKHGIPLLLIRLDAEADLSAARMRWRVGSVPSAPPLWNPAAPGRPAWRAELFRARAHTPGEWILRDGDNSLAAERPGRQSPAAPPDHGDMGAGAGARSLAAL